MAYELTSAQRAPLLDGEGSPIATAALSGGGQPAPWGIGSAATVQDDGSGFLECVGNHPGSLTFDLVEVATGAAASHDVTVTAAPFDWSLGAPVPK